jgi:hypothetical protein
MSPTDAIRRSRDRLARPWFPYLLLLGVYLTLRGYHSFDGDQAYRLPLLLHRQDPGLYANDPFVRSLDEFNPHRGSLALLDAISRPLGLPAGLFVVFALTFLTTCRAVLRLAEAVWPQYGHQAGWVAVWLFFAAKAGNIGTNHLFEAMVLDRLVALALGWFAIAEAVIAPERGWWRSALALALAAVIHPSVGLQLAMVLGSGWLAWAIVGKATQVDRTTVLRGLAAVGLAVSPGVSVHLPQATTLLGGLPTSLFWILSVELQNPQHMLPHLWRMPQWLAWFSYLALVALQLTEANRAGVAKARRRRLAIVLAVTLIGLAGAWYAIEVLRIVQVTIFQPFRMGTVVRGMCIVLVSGRIARLWWSGTILDRIRAAVVSVGFLGDWLLVVATSAELAVSTIEASRRMIGGRWIPRGVAVLVFGAMIALGVNFLAHHDTESGHVPLLLAFALGLAAGTRFWCLERLTVASSALETVSPRTPPCPPFVRGGELERARHLLFPPFRRGCTGGFVGRFPRARAKQLLSALTDGKASPRFAVAIAAAWLYPGLALLAALVPLEHPASRLAAVRGLVNHCRLYPLPLDDIERLALWCREHTSASSRFIGPPGPKTFRLWSRRSLAFNRSGSPYQGAGLADWFARFADHVDYHGTPEEFVHDYVRHRHEFEARYQSLSDSQRAALAVRQGAEYVVAEAPKGAACQPGRATAAPLELLHVEGRYAVYRVNPAALVHRQP